MGHSGAGGKLIHKKNKKQKISWHCPFKQIVIVYVVYDQNQCYFIVSKIVIDNLHELCFFLLFSVIILERKIIQDDERSGG